MPGRKVAAAVGMAVLCALARASDVREAKHAGDQAESGAADGLRSTLDAERTKLLAGSRTRVGAVLELKAPEGDVDFNFAPVSLALVMDRSGSMRGAGKMGMVHTAGAGLVDRLSSADEIGLVAYSNWSEVVRPMAAVSDATGVKSLIAGLAPGGGTNLGGGLESGIAFFRGDLGNGHVKRLILLTDGLANQGVTDPEALARYAAEAFSKGVRTTAIGLGSDYNEKLLARIAHAGGGEFYYAASPSDLPELYRAELEQGRTVVVRDLVATVRTSEGARFVEMVGYPSTGGSDRAREVRIGDLFTRQERATILLFDLAPPALAEGANWKAATVDLAWADADGRKHKATLPLSFEVTASESGVADSAVNEVRARVIENDNYRALDEAMDLFRKGQRDKALAKITEAEKTISEEAAAADDAKLIRQAGELSQARREIEQGEDARSVSIHNVATSNCGFRGNGRVSGQLIRGGGSYQSEMAANATATWLSGHQSIDGSWGEGPERRLETSLALLSLLASGHTEKVGQHKSAVAGGIAWLVAKQRQDGRIGEVGMPVAAAARYREACSHAICAAALAEAYGMARVESTGGAAQKAADWLAGARPFALADEAVGSGAALTDDDVAGIGWLIMALKSARVSGLKTSSEVFEAAVRFLDRHELDREGQGPVRYAFGGGEARRLDTMVGLFARSMLGSKHSDILPSAVDATADPGDLPEWGDKGEAFDWYYAYFGNLVCFQMGGDVWRGWNARLRDLLVSKIRTGDSDAGGSWDPVGTFDGRNRAVPTAVGALCLEVYYRYLPLYR